MNRISDTDRLDSLILLLDDTVLQEIYDNPSISDSYFQLSKFLRDNFNGGISIQAASDELQLLVGRKAQKPDDLDNISRKINYYIDIKFPSDSKDRKNREKLEYLAKVLPSAIQNSYFCSSKNTLEEGVAIAKKIWIHEMRAERDRVRGVSIIKSNSHNFSNSNRERRQNYQNMFCSICKMNNHTNANCRNSKFKMKNQANNIEVCDEQINTIMENVDNNNIDPLTDEDNSPSVPQNHSFRNILKNINEKDNLIGAVIKINGINIVSLLDTGSNCLIISKKLKDKLNLTTCKESIIVTYQSTNTAFKIDTPITVQIQKEKFTLTDNVYASKEDFKNNNYDAIIGTNILKRLVAIIDLQNGKLIMKDKTSSDLLNNKIPTSYMILSNQDINVNIDDFVNKLKSKYPMAYARHSFDIGPGKIMVNDIEIYDNKEMIKAPYYSVPVHEKEKISQLLYKWIDNGLLEKSSSNILHPIMLITKPDKKNDLESRRFIADLRQINSITKSVNYNTPKIQELLHSLQSFSFITKIDLKNAFFQLSLPPQSRKFYGIRTPIGNLQFRRLPQGGKVSSAIFQRTMEEAFSKLRNNCLIYCDDILLLSSGTIKDHEYIINQFMEIANDLQLKVSLEKSVFFARDVKFLGYHINKFGTKPDISNVNNILQRDIPKRKKHCISFLQALNYFRHVIPNFSKRAAPLYEVSKGRDGVITLNSEQLHCYHTLRTQLMNAPSMFHPVHGNPFILTTDASNHTCGAILSQIQQDKEVPLSFFSCRLPATKRARSPTFLELYAVAKSLQNYKYLLSSAEVIVRSDHKPLIHLTSSNCDRKYLELLETINQFNVTLKYIPGKSNMVADWLSRLCNESDNSNESNNNNIESISSNESNISNNSNITSTIINNNNDKSTTNENVPLSNVIQNSLLPIVSHTIKRPRGRPPKHSLPNTLKKSRGRPKTSNKYNLDIDTSKSTSSTISTNELHNSNILNDTNNSKQVDILPKRPRGRPRKNILPIPPQMLHDNSNITDNTTNLTDLNNIHSTEDSDDLMEINNKLDNSLNNLDSASELMLKNGIFDLNIKELQQNDIKCQQGIQDGTYDNLECFKDDHGLIKVKLNGENNQELVVIPDKAIDSIFKLSHDFNGHFGFLKTKTNINRTCYISGIAKKLSNYLSHCHVCKLRNTVTSQKGPIKTVLPAPVLDELSMDILGPLSTPGSQGERFVLNVIDTGSRFVFPIPIKSQQHEVIMHQLMDNVFLKYGFPKKIRCDNAQNFKAKSLQELMAKLNIELIYSTPHYSNSNSICERYLRTLQAGVNKLIEMTGREWNTYIPFLAFVYNSNVIKSFNLSPFQLMFARALTTTLDLFLRQFSIGLHDRNTTIYDMMEKAEISRCVASENHMEERMKLNYGKHVISTKSKILKNPENSSNSKISYNLRNSKSSNNLRNSKSSNNLRNSKTLNNLRNSKNSIKLRNLKKFKNSNIVKNSFKSYGKNENIYVKNKNRKSKFENIYNGPYKVIENFNSKIKYKRPSGRILVASKTNVRS